MEDQTSPSTNTMPEPAASRTPGLVRSIAEQRRQIEEFLATQRDHMDGVEAKVAKSLGRIINELIRDRAEADSNQRKLAKRAAQLDQDSQHMSEMRAELDIARADWEQTRQSAETQQATFLEQLRRELEQKPKSDGDDVSASDVSASDEYKQRYDMALEDIRELRENNESLKKELAEVQDGAQSGRGAAQTAGALSWEAQKQQMLAALDENYDGDTQKDIKERAEIEEIIGATDRAIAQKAEEIRDLKQLLEKQSENIGTVAVGAAAFSGMLDSDQIIQEERESLKQLQEELQEKLRTAEIDISVERAKIARERSEIDEKFRLLAQQQIGENAPEVSETADHEKPSRGRWLSRLGLNDLEE